MLKPFPRSGFPKSLTRGLYCCRPSRPTYGLRPLSRTPFRHLTHDSYCGWLPLSAGDLSRNRTVGLRLGRGETLQQIHVGRRWEVVHGRWCTGGSSIEGARHRGAAYLKQATRGIPEQVSVGLQELKEGGAEARRSHPYHTRRCSTKVGAHACAWRSLLPHRYPSVPPSSPPPSQASMGGSVAEGVPTAAAVHSLARRMGVDCPIMEGIYRVIHGRLVLVFSLTVIHGRLRRMGAERKGRANAGVVIAEEGPCSCIRPRQWAGRYACYCTCGAGVPNTAWSLCQCSCVCFWLQAVDKRMHGNRCCCRCCCCTPTCWLLSAAEGADPRAIVTEVMSRDLKPEVAPDILQV